MDSLSPERRSWNMSRIRAIDTRPEIKVRSLHYRSGFRFRLHVKDLPGRPDIVLRKFATVIFVHGCFCHRHKGCKQCYNPKSNSAFWETKFAGNIERDRENVSALKASGWNVITVWECELSDAVKLEKRLTRLLQNPLK